MKPIHALALAVGLVAVVAGTFSDAGRALDNPLSEVRNATITCAASNATSPTRILTAGTSASAMLLVNSLTNCVRVGGSGVTSSTGASIGSGCLLGPSLAVDTQIAWCRSEDTTPRAIQVLYGVKQ